MHCIIFLPVTGMKCSYGKISSPLTEIPVGKTEISVTEPARPLIWTQQSFYKGFRGKVRSRNPGQPRQPGSYEEALIDFILSNARRFYSPMENPLSVKGFIKTGGSFLCTLSLIDFSRQFSKNEARAKLLVCIPISLLHKVSQQLFLQLCRY